MKEELKGLEKICAQYLKNIIADCDNLLQILDGKDFLGETEEKAVRKFGHQSYGSGSSYGFDFISEAGQSITKAVHGNEGISRIVSIIKELKEQVKKAQRENQFEA